MSEHIEGQRQPMIGASSATPDQNCLRLFMCEGIFLWDDFLVLRGFLMELSVISLNDNLRVRPICS